MRTIWKYKLKITDHQQVEMPLGSEILKTVKWDEIVSDPYHLAIWALVDPECKTMMRWDVFIFGTGHSIPDDSNAHAYHDDLSYLGTAIGANNLVWHVFVR